MERTIHGITVKEALSLHVFKNVRVLGGKRGLNRIITSVDIMEEPDIIPMVKEGQLLMTTAFSIKNDLSAQEKLIPALAEKGLAGLMIKLSKGYLTGNESAMIHTADKYAFPLLEMPYNYSHPTVLEAIYEALIVRKEDHLRNSEEAHQKLMEIVLSGGGMAEICRALYQIMQNPVAIVGADGAILEGYPKPTWFSKKSNRGFLQQNELEVGGKTFPFVNIPIKASDYNYGSILVLEVNRKVRDMDFMILERSATVASLSIINRTLLREMETRYLNEFLFDWMDGKVTSEEALFGRAQIIGWNLGSSFLLILMEIDNYADLLLKDPNGSYQVSHLKGLLRSVAEKFLKGLNEYYIVGDQGGYFLILLQQPKDFLLDKSKKEVKNHIESILNEFTSQTESTCTVGIGRYRKDLMEMTSCYQEAKTAIQLSKLFRRGGRITFFDDLGVYRLFSHSDNEEMWRFVMELYEPLRNYDKNHNTGLIETTEAYFNYNGNVSQMAKNLYTHYNTIVYRLTRIQEITGIDLSDAEKRLSLQLAIKIGKTISN